MTKFTAFILALMPCHICYCLIKEADQVFLKYLDILSFGFENGANTNPFSVEPTSYDYDSPISEAGDLTKKYFLFKEVIKKYLPIPPIDVSPYPANPYIVNAVTKHFLLFVLPFDFGIFFGAFIKDMLVILIYNIVHFH